MVTHMVIFTWVAGTTEEQVQTLGRKLNQLARELADWVTINHGPDLGFRDGNGDYAIVATFADRAGWDAYQADPRHKVFVSDVVAPLLASRVTAQI